MKNRGICQRCGAKKYLKFLRKIGNSATGIGALWICSNPEKCNGRGANYRK